MTITTSQLRRAQADGAVRGASLRADGSTFILLIHTRKGDRIFVETRKTDGQYVARRFIDAQTVLRLLHKAEVLSVRLDLTSWEPDRTENPSAGRKRARVIAGSAGEIVTDVEENGRQADSGLAGILPETVSRNMASPTFPEIESHPDLPANPPDQVISSQTGDNEKPGRQIRVEVRKKRRFISRQP